jgi:hypothetical protein
VVGALFCAGRAFIDNLSQVTGAGPGCGLSLALPL